MVQARTSTAFNLSPLGFIGGGNWQSSHDKEFLGFAPQALRDWSNTLAEQIVAGKRLSREDAIALSHIEDEENIVLLCVAAGCLSRLFPIASFALISIS